MQSYLPPEGIHSVDLMNNVPFELHFNGIRLRIVRVSRVCDNTTPWIIPYHAHENFEFHYVSGGKGYIDIENSGFEVVKGDFFITAPYVRHRQSSHATSIMEEFCIECMIDYLEENGAYAVGMTRIGDNTYFFDENGIMQSGWLCRDGKWYCFGEDGAMKRSCRLERAGRSGYAGEDGALLTGYQKREDGVWFFGRESGLTLPEGLLLDGEARYWVGENGQLVTDSWKAYHKRLYYFDETGLLTRSVLAELDTVTGLAAEKTEGGFTLSWTAVKGAVSYEIVNADTGEVLGRTEATAFAVSLGEGTLSVKVRAIGEKSEGAFSEALLLKAGETPASSEEESSDASSAPESDTPASSDSESSAPAPVDTGVRSGLVGWLALLLGSLTVAAGALFTAKKHKAKEQ